jgi:very-short-patch-repair endonuclease
MMGDGASWEERGFGEPDRLTPGPSPSGERGDERGKLAEWTAAAFSVRGVSGRVRDNARVLRRYQTPAKDLLWNELRGRKIEGLKFRRQCAIGKFIADFLCYECALVIEVDGAQHADANVREYDNDVRTRYLNEQGFEVLRFTNREVETELHAVIERIAHVARMRRTVLPSPQRERGRG